MLSFKFNNFLKVSGFITLTSVMVACTKNFQSINTNPYQPTDTMLTYDNFKIGGYFTQLEESVMPIGTAADATGPANNYQIAFDLCVNNWGGYTAAQTSKFNGGNNFMSYFFYQDWVNGTFTDRFTSVFNPWLQIKKNVGTSHPEVFALAQIIKISGIHMTTDMFGPIPYSALGSGSLSVPYDAQQKIYQSFFSELTDAIAVLSSYQRASNSIVPDYDAVYGGDVTKWIRFANSLMLRLAMRIVYADPANAQKYAEQAVNNSFGVIEDINDGAQMSSGAGFIFQNPLTTLWGSYGDTRMNASILSYLKGYNDPRLAVYASKVTIGSSTDYFGVRTGATTDATSFPSFSSPNINYSTPLYWLKASEVSFLKAEGALRGWNMNGTAEQFYEDGISKSFAENGVASSTYEDDNTSKPASYTNPYYGGQNAPASSVITVKWNDADPFEPKLERIITQKWLASFPNGSEAWAEYRRTGYPKLFPVQINNSGGSVSTAAGVRRMVYPTDEYLNNAVNVQTAVQSLLSGPDNGGTKVWWDKKGN